jgi:DNA ligase (NAD+)
VVKTKPDDESEVLAAEKNAETESEGETLVSRRRSVWALIHQEIDRRSASSENLRHEVEGERTQRRREIDSLVPERDDLEREAALHKERQKGKPRDQREKLPKDLQDKRAKVKGQLQTLEERLNKAGMPKELGPVVAESTLDFFKSAIGKKVLHRLKGLEIWPQGGLARAEGRHVAGNQPLAGRTFVLTGTLPTLSRDEASALIRDAGGNLTGAVSKNTDYVLAGESAGSKLDKARELGVKILSEQKFLEMLDLRSNSKPGSTQGELF